MSDQDAAAIAAMLSGMALFEGLSPQALAEIIQACPVTHLKPGHRLISEYQDHAAELHVVIDGEAAVTINGTEVGRLRAGELAGEISSAGISPPVANVVAVTEMQVLAIPHAVLGELTAIDAAFRQRLRRAAFARIQA